MNNPKDKVSYSVICKRVPESSVYFSTYKEALHWAELDQPADRPHYIVKRIEHFEICGVIDSNNKERRKEMRNPKRISRLMNILQYYWFNEVPDWRFGQLISNLESAAGGDIFYMEDEDFVQLVEQYFKSIKK